MDTVQIFLALNMFAAAASPVLYTLQPEVAKDIVQWPENAEAGVVSIGHSFGFYVLDHETKQMIPFTYARAITITADPADDLVYVGCIEHLHATALGMYEHFVNSADNLEFNSQDEEQ